MTQSLDHLILFLPADPTTNLPAIPPLFTQNFTLTPGGTHADGLTSNTLIPLSDGSYIELISFLSPDAPTVTQHWWGPDGAVVGWKDWCLTNRETAQGNWVALGGQESAFAKPVWGGRVRGDGVRVEWAVTFPEGERGGQEKRGRVPFFCHDVTERGVRVPGGDGDGVEMEHMCGAVGMGEITVVVGDKGVLEETREVYKRIFEEEGVVRGEEVCFHIGRVREVDGLSGGVRVVLRLPRGEEERRRTGKSGYWFGDVVLLARAGGGKEKGTRRRLDEGESVGGLWVEYV